MNQKLENNKKTIIFCGGHHTSSLPIIDEILEKNLYKIVFIGRERAFSDDENFSLEFLDIQKRKIPFYDIGAPKFYKSNFLFPFKFLFSFFRSLFLILYFRPSLIVSFGGYIAVPVTLAAFIIRVKIITHEQTVVTGLANKFISFISDRVLITWPNSRKYFDPKKTVQVGLPLRKSFFNPSTIFFPITNNLPTIFITCGKTGSHIINEFVFENMRFFLNNFNIIHQSGDYSVTSDFQRLKLKYEEIKDKSKGAYFLYKFMDEAEVNSAFRHCDFLISRSGAHTIYEILHFSKPAIMIPIPWVSHNEQYLNAKLVYDAGLGFILEEQNLNLDNFKNLAEKILVRKFKLRDGEIKKLIETNTTEKFINEIQDLIH